MSTDFTIIKDKLSLKVRSQKENWSLRMLSSMKAQTKCMVGIVPTTELMALVVAITDLQNALKERIRIRIRVREGQKEIERKIKHGRETTK